MIHCIIKQKEEKKYQIIYTVIITKIFLIITKDKELWLVFQYLVGTHISKHAVFILNICINYSIFYK